MRTAILTALVAFTIPKPGFATEPLELGRESPSLLASRVEVGLALPAIGDGADFPLELSMPTPAWSNGSRSRPDFGISPDVALEGTSLTLRLVPTRRAPDPAEPLVLLPRLAGVGSRWFGLDFAAWF